MSKNRTVAHAEVAAASASAEPDFDALEREARRALRAARHAEHVANLTTKAARLRLQMEETEAALAQATAQAGDI